MTDNYQSPYEFINNLKTIELKMLKIYIKTNLINSFINLQNFWQIYLSFL